MLSLSLFLFHLLFVLDNIAQGKCKHELLTPPPVTLLLYRLAFTDAVKAVLQFRLKMAFYS